LWENLSFLVDLNAKAVFLKEASTVGMNAHTTFGEQNNIPELHKTHIK